QTVRLAPRRVAFHLAVYTRGRHPPGCMTTVLFLVSGLGLGNSTRCHAVIQCLRDFGAVVFVATSENGLWYFADKPEIERVFEMGSLYYGKKDGRLSVGATLASLMDFLRIQRRNSELIERVVNHVRPDVVVSDS